MTSLQDLARIVFIGIGATVVMDAWLMFLKRQGVQMLDFRFIGRWVGHLLRGQIAHASIRQSPRIPGELVWGWLTHYAVGIAFAGLLVLMTGLAWTRNPSLLPAVAVGMSTVMAPLFVMQPAMGSGFAASRTPTPVKNCLRSLANHTVFGLGLYASAVLLALAAR
jgi:Protein of unknown function (DUF2938)